MIDAEDSEPIKLSDSDQRRLNLILEDVNKSKASVSRTAKQLMDYVCEHSRSLKQLPEELRRDFFETAWFKNAIQWPESALENIPSFLQIPDDSRAGLKPRTGPVVPSTQQGNMSMSRWNLKITNSRSAS